jgi:hypothetical protein
MIRAPGPTAGGRPCRSKETLDVIAPPRHSSNGKKLTVRGTTYTVREFIALGASGLTPAFVGDGSAIVAEYATGR